MAVLLDLPASGRVWEMLTGPGERVSKGQDLMRVLDCSHPLVSANVDESVYNRLKVGGRATFRPSQGGGRQYDGVIVNLTGGRRRFREFRHTSRGDAQELVLRDRRRQRHERGRLLGRTTQQLASSWGRSGS